MLSFAQELTALSAAVAIADQQATERAALPTTAEVKKARADAVRWRKDVITAYLSERPAKSRWATIDQIVAATKIENAHLAVQTLITLRKNGVCISRKHKDYRKPTQWSLT